MKQNIRSVMAIALAGCMGLLTARVDGATYYWDTDGSIGGFGDIAGMWGTSAFWSADSTGASDGALTPITTSDGINFGTDTLALGSTAAAVGVSGAVTVNSITFGAAQAAPVTLSGGTSITLGGTTPSITVNNASNTISSVLAGSSFTKAGNGTLTLSGTNSHTGTTTISAGTLKLQGANMWKTARTYTINSGAVLHLEGGAEFNVLTTSATNTINGTGTLRLNGWFGTSNPGTSGKIAISLGAGALIDVQSGAALQNGGWSYIIWNNNQASLKMDGSLDFADGNSVTVDALTGSGTITKTWGPETKTLTVGTANGSGTFSGTIVNPAGTIALTKTGTGTQTLSGNNRYSGGTTVSVGTLLVNGSITGTVSVASGAYLGGTGAITGNVTYATGAFGIFTNDAPLRFTGPVTLNGNTVHLTLPDNLAEGTYLLATNTSGGFSGTFAATPVIDSGSAVAPRAISTDAGAVRLIVSSTDTIPPSPDPMTFAVNPWALNTSTVVMTATTATDGFNPPVEYFFTNTVNGNTSGWITGTGWTNSGLTEGVSYGYRVMARDAVSNATAFSSVFSVVAADPTIFWDANNTGANRTDGSGTWLNANQWWTGIANSTWNNTIPNNAVIGNSGGGGTITLGTVTAGSVTFTNFTGTYTLTGGSLTQSGGVTIGTTSANVTISTVIGGAGGITKYGTGIFTLDNNSNSYSGPTRVFGGILKIGAIWNNNASIPGGILGYPGTGSNLEINGGIVGLQWNLERTLGAGSGQIQLTGGRSGFAMLANPRPDITFTSGTYEVVWGALGEGAAIGYFNPSVFVLNDSAAGGSYQLNFKNKIDLNGADRTVETANTAYYGQLSGIIRNSTGTAGLTKTGTGELILTAANTFNGPVTVNQGTLNVTWISNVNGANPLGQSPAAATNLLLANGTTLRYTGGAATCNRGFTINGTAAGHTATLDASGTGAINLTSTNTPAYGTGNQSRKLILAGSNTGTNTLAASIADNGSGKVALTKTGAGTWVLTGTNSYSGDTIVTNGILRITGEKVLSPLTSVYLSTGSQTGRVDLAFTGTQKIAALYINGVKQAIGTPVSANGTTITGTGFLGKSNGGMVILIR